MSWLIRRKSLEFVKIFKDFVRCFSANPENLELNNNSSSENDNHIYKTRFSRDELVEKLLESVVYNESEIVVLNKPYGIGKTKPELIRKATNITRPLNEYYLEDVLPDVAKKLGYDTLHIAKNCERYTSGVLVLASTESKKQQIFERIAHAKANKISVEKYFVVSLNSPKEPSLKKKFGVEFQKDDDKKMPVVVDKWSRNAMKRKDVILCDWEHNVVTSSKYASLVEVKLSKTKNHLLRIIMATKLFSPILGDNIHGNKVQKVMGVYMTVKPSQILHNMPMDIDEETMSVLNITPADVMVIPTHMHLYSVFIPKIDNLDFFVSVPPPDYFLWTCERLELNTQGLFD